MQLEKWDYEDAVYWATITVTTVGFGDMVPRSEGGKAFTILYIIISVIYITTAIADLAQYPVVLQKKREEMAVVRQFGTNITPDSFEYLMDNDFYDLISAPGSKRENRPSAFSRQSLSFQPASTYSSSYASAPSFLQRQVVSEPPSPPDSRMVSKAEFILSLLFAMDKVAEKDVIIASTVFDTLDADKDGARGAILAYIISVYFSIMYAICNIIVDFILFHKGISLNETLISARWASCRPVRRKNCRRNPHVMPPPRVQPPESVYRSNIDVRCSYLALLYSINISTFLTYAYMYFMHSLFGGASESLKSQASSSVSYLASLSTKLNEQMLSEDHPSSRNATGNPELRSDEPLRLFTRRDEASALPVPVDGISSSRLPQPARFTGTGSVAAMLDDL
jgi:hypothetical protein